MSKPSVSEKRRQTTLARRFATRATRFSAIFIIIAIIAMALLATTFATSSYKDSSRRSGSASTSNPTTKDQIVRSERKFSGPVDKLIEAGTTVAPGMFSALLPPSPPPPPGTETITLYAADCATPKSSFNLGDTVCAVVSGGPDLSIIKRRLAVGDSNDLIRDITDADTGANLGNAVSITTDPQVLKFQLPSSSTSTVGDQTVSNLGVWRVNTIHPSRFSVRNSAFFTVSDPNHLAYNLAIYNNDDSGGSITAGSNILYTLWITNYGPDAASNVTVTNDIPANTTFLSGNDGGLTCTFPTGSTGTTTCTLASLAQGASAKVTLVLNVNAGTSPGTIITSTATISADSLNTAETYNTDNTSTSNIGVVAGAAESTCTLACPTNITVAADTTVNGQRGAYVTFPSPQPVGDCGNPPQLIASPASGSFFPAGTTTVNFSSSTGDGACSFNVFVVDTGSNPPTISCPVNKTVDADSNCSATVVLGTPTTTGDNVTVSSSRSDGLPLNSPFSAGTTTVTWTATSHDVAGPWDDESAHTTGTASCTQTVTVNDVTPPNIAATDQTVSADANCQAVVPDYSNTVTDNCACDSSDDANACAGHPHVSVTQSPAPGTLVGLGPHTIHITANDGSSNNNGAGNTSTKDITLTVNDTTPPTFTNVPGNVTAYTGPNATSCDTVVSDATLGTATATDNCGSVNITRSGVPAGNVFPKGTTTITYTATDGAGNQTQAQQTVTVIDNTPPVISCPSNITVYLPLHTADTSMVVDYATPVGTDNCAGAVTTQTAGLASHSAFPVGTTTNTFVVTDAAGNSASCSFTVTVLYDFSGFFAPVYNPPTLNVVKAGSAVPVKFSLSGNKGLGIVIPGYPQSGVIPCDASAPVQDLTGTVTAGGSSLTYDATSDQYIYTWKTDSTWTGCRQLVIPLNDGTTHAANFKFK